MLESIANRAILKDKKLYLLINSKDLSTTKKVCSLVNCKYHLMSGMYEIPLNYRNVQSLMEWKFLFGKSLRDWERTTRHSLEISRIKLKKIDGLTVTLRPFQARGVEFIDECGGRALIADDPGLGKTIQALAWCQLHIVKRPVLVIAPSNLKVNWKREINSKIGVTNVQVLEGRTPYQITGEFVIINYDVIDWWTQELKEYGFVVLIADESHYIRNNTSKRTKAFKRISKYFENIIALTGTPIENYPVEIYNIINILQPTLFPNYYYFTKTYCDAKNDAYGRNVKGVSNPEELHRILSKSVMIRRKKSEVLKELPSKIVTVIPLEMTNKKEYENAEKKFLEYLETKFHNDLSKDGIEKELKQYAKLHDVEVGEDLDSSDLLAIKNTKIEKAKKAPILVQMSALKQLAVKGKMKAVIEWINDFLESKEKLVVFAINKDVITELMKHFPHAARLDGSVTSKIKRQAAIDNFNNDPNCNLFIANIDSGGVGLTLTVSSNVAMVQYPWTPGKYVQASDRVHRMTQTKQVTVWNFVAENSIEEKILKALSVKEKIITDVLDGGKYDPSSLASEVLKMYNIK